MGVGVTTLDDKTIRLDGVIIDFLRRSGVPESLYVSMEYDRWHPTKRVLSVDEHRDMRLDRRHGRRLSDDQVFTGFFEYLDDSDVTNSQWSGCTALGTAGSPGSWLETSQSVKRAQ